MAEVGGDRASSVSRRGGSNTACRKSALEVPLAWLLSTPPFIGGWKTVKVKLISEICRSVSKRSCDVFVRGGGMFDRCRS